MARCRCKRRRSRKKRLVRKLWKTVGRGVEVGAYVALLSFLLQAAQNGGF